MVRPFPPVRATPPIAHAEIAMVAYPLAAFGVADATLAVERIPAIAERPPEIIYGLNARVIATRVYHAKYKVF